MPQKPDTIRKEIHTNIETERLREEYSLWYFTPEKTMSQEEWAIAHNVTPRTLTNWKKRPDFIAKMEEFRKTYREDGDEALQNLFRFAKSPEPRVALPAIKIVVEVMGYTSPLKIEHTARGMSLMEYLANVGQRAIEQYAENSGGQQAIPPMVAIEGSFREEEFDPWETADLDKLN